jgi:hypothetical protein
MIIGMDYSEDYDPEQWEFDHYMDDELLAGYHKPLLKRTKSNYVAHPQQPKCVLCGCYMTHGGFCRYCYPQD